MPIFADRRLGRLIEFDHRSLSYPIASLLPKETKKPRSYTWECRATLDQGQEGACVGFGFAHELAARPSRRLVHQAGAFAIYRKAQTLDPWPGEDYEGTSVLAGIKAVQQMYPKFIQSYRWAFGLDDVILTLGYLGPVVLGINWYYSMYSPDSNGIIKVEGQLAGGHCILAKGVDIKKKLITLHNSWGSDYGKGGSCYISYDNLNRLLKEGGEALVPVKRG